MGPVLLLERKKYIQEAVCVLKHIDIFRTLQQIQRENAKHYDYSDRQIR